MRRPALCVVGLVALSSCTARPTRCSAGVIGRGCAARERASSTMSSTVTRSSSTIGGQQETVRLIGIDTPETVKPDSPVECFGPEASARTKELLPEGTPVRLVARRRAPRRRTAGCSAYVYRASDGLFVNLALVAGRVRRTVPVRAQHRVSPTSSSRAARTAEAAGRRFVGRRAGHRRDVTGRSMRVPVPRPPPQHIEIRP